MKKETRGAPKGNRNAVGHGRPKDSRRGRKEYVQVFGQRWNVEMGSLIKSYLERTGLTQKAFLEKVIADYILSHEHETTNG